MAEEFEPTRDPRAPVQIAVRFRHADLSEFLEEYSANVSASGMFIKASPPFAPGTRFELRFTVGDEVTVIAATAEVVWVRTEESGPNQPVGMGVRFVELDEMSREIISRIVRLHTDDNYGD